MPDPMLEPMPDPMLEPATFWQLADLPAQDGDLPAEPAIDRLGRPDITVDGRNLADLLRSAYTAFTQPPP
jgi:hypothetical protein